MQIYFGDLTCKNNRNMAEFWKIRHDAIKTSFFFVVVFNESAIFHCLILVWVSIQATSQSFSFNHPPPNPMDQRDPVEKQNIPQEMAREDGWTRRKTRVCYHIPCIQLGMMKVGVLLGVSFASTFRTHLAAAPCCCQGRLGFGQLGLCLWTCGT